MRFKNYIKKGVLEIIKRIHPPQESLLRRLAKRPSIVIRIPKSSESWIELGRKALSENQHHRAQEAFEKALEQNIKSSWAWHGLGDLHQHINQYEQALNAYSKACSFS
ncbi:MAG: hypothetical protein CMK59_07430, partial [Proteobacteria bacterium]|nr:hypothetical protein [Pseudomonadota bacterium]